MVQEVLEGVLVLVSSALPFCSRALPLVGTRPRHACSRNAVVLVRVRLESPAAAGDPPADGPLQQPDHRWDTASWVSRAKGKKP